MIVKFLFACVTSPVQKPFKRELIHFNALKPTNDRR